MSAQPAQNASGAPGAGSRFARKSTRHLGERAIEAALFTVSLSAVAVTVAIVGILLYESAAFFEHVSIVDFLTDTQWTIMFADKHFGVLPLLAGTLVNTTVALLLAVPVGTGAAVYLSEFASEWTRETVKPTLELLAGIPTVVYGYFALLMVTPALQWFMPDLPGFNMLGPGRVPQVGRGMGQGPRPVGGGPQAAPVATLGRDQLPPAAQADRAGAAPAAPPAARDEQGVARRVAAVRRQGSAGHDPMPRFPQEMPVT